MTSTREHRAREARHACSLIKRRARTAGCVRCAWLRDRDPCQRSLLALTTDDYSKYDSTPDGPSSVVLVASKLKKN